MKNTVWNPVTRDIIIFSKESEAVNYLTKNKYTENGRQVLYRTTADICSNCGGERDTGGWCANYCMGSE